MRLGSRAWGAGRSHGARLVLPPHASLSRANMLHHQRQPFQTSTQRRHVKTWSAGTASRGSPQARHLLDASIVEHVGIYGHPLLSAEQALHADPNLVLGHVIKAGLALFSTGLPYSAQEIQEPLSAAARALQLVGGSDTEKAHLEALQRWVAKESMGEAVHVWEDILSRNPRDELAVKFAHDAYFFLGRAPEMKGSLDKVLGEWEMSSDPNLFGYLLGMHAFSLEENRMYPQAERRARAALSVNARDSWAIHAIVHVHEMEGRPEEGIHFLTEEMANWKWCTGLACHLWWHMCLHLVEQGKHAQALDIYDDHIFPMMKSSNAMLDLVDASSLLQRIEFDGGSVDDRWRGLSQIFVSHANDHVLAYNDVHLAIALLGAGENDAFQRFENAFFRYAHEGTEQQTKEGNRLVAATVGLPLTQAFAAYRAKDFKSATSILLPLVSESGPLTSSFMGLGGSNAQRDLFAQLFLMSLGQSNPEGHLKQLLDTQLFHRTVAKSNSSPLTSRLVQRFAIEPHLQETCETESRDVRQKFQH